MTHAAPDPAWPLFTDPAADRPTFCTAELVDELRREIDVRTQGYPRLVIKGHLTAHEADRQIALFAAIVDDVAGGSANPAFDWDEKIHALRREINLRRATYPRRIEKGQLAAALATHRLAALEAVHLLYWVRGFGWAPVDPDPVTIAEFVAKRVVLGREVFPDEEDALDPLVREIFRASLWHPIRRQPGILPPPDLTSWLTADEELADVAERLRDCCLDEAVPLIEAAAIDRTDWPWVRHDALADIAAEWRSAADDRVLEEPIVTTSLDRLIVLEDAVARIERRLVGPEGAGPHAAALALCRAGVCTLLMWERQRYFRSLVSPQPLPLAAAA